jgi:hypothetical protein
LTWRFSRAIDGFDNAITELLERDDGGVARIGSLHLQLDLLAAGCRR